MLLTPPTLARYTVGLLIAVAVAFLMWYFRSIVVYILVSALLAIIFKPLVGRLARLRIRGWHLPRWAAALATLILIWVLFVVACTLFVPLVFDKLYQSLRSTSVRCSVPSRSRSPVCRSISTICSPCPTNVFR